MPLHFNRRRGRLRDGDAFDEERRMDGKGRQADQRRIEFFGEACGKADPLLRHAVRVDIGHQHRIGHIETPSGQCADLPSTLMIAIIEAHQANLNELRNDAGTEFPIFSKLGLSSAFGPSQRKPHKSFVDASGSRHSTSLK
jgi:hypothetical protein